MHAPAKGEKPIVKTTTVLTMSSLSPAPIQKGAAAIRRQTGGCMQSRRGSKPLQGTGVPEDPALRS